MIKYRNSKNLQKINEVINKLKSNNWNTFNISFFFSRFFRHLSFRSGDIIPDIMAISEKLLLGIQIHFSLDFYLRVKFYKSTLLKELFTKFDSYTHKYAAICACYPETNLIFVVLPKNLPQKLVIKQNGSYRFDSDNWNVGIDLEKLRLIPTLFPDEEFNLVE